MGWPWIYPLTLLLVLRLSSFLIVKKKCHLNHLKMFCYSAPNLFSSFHIMEAHPPLNNPHIPVSLPSSSDFCLWVSLIWTPCVNGLMRNSSFGLWWHVLLLNCFFIYVSSVLTDTTAHAPSVGKQRQDKKGGRGEAALVTRALHHTGSLPCEPAL